MGLPHLPLLPLPHQAQHDATLVATTAADDDIPRNGFLVCAPGWPVASDRAALVRQLATRPFARPREGEGARPAVLESKNVGQPQEAERK